MSSNSNTNFVPKDRIEDIDDGFYNNLETLGPWTENLTKTNDRRLQAPIIKRDDIFQQNLNPYDVIYNIYKCPLTPSSGIKIGFMMISQGQTNSTPGFYTPHIITYLNEVQSKSSFPIPSLDELQEMITIVPLGELEEYGSNYEKYLCAAYDSVYDNNSFNAKTNQFYLHTQLTLEMLFSGLPTPEVYVFILKANLTTSDRKYGIGQFYYIDYELLLPQVEKYGICCLFSNVAPSGARIVEPSASYLKNLSVPFFLSSGNRGSLLPQDKISRSTYEIAIGSLGYLIDYDTQVGFKSSTGGFYNGIKYTGSTASDGIDLSIPAPIYQSQLTNFPGNYQGQSGNYYAIPMASCLGGYFCFYTSYDNFSGNHSSESGKWNNMQGTSISVVIMAMIFAIFSPLMNSNYNEYGLSWLYKNYSQLFTYISSSLEETSDRNNSYWTTYQWNPLCGFGYPNLANWESVINSTTSSSDGSSSSSSSTSTEKNKILTTEKDIGIITGTTILAGTVAAATYYYLSKKNKSTRYEKVSDLDGGEVELSELNNTDDLVTKILSKSTSTGRGFTIQKQNLTKLIDSIINKEDDPKDILRRLYNLVENKTFLEAQEIITNIQSKQLSGKALIKLLDSLLKQT